nr:uncharacterized protein LOC124810418 isoform X3 [Hydra vulgaris]
MADNYYIATRKRSNPSTSSVSLWRKRRLAVIQMSVSTQSSSEVTRNEQSDDSFTDISNDVEDNDFLFIKSDLSNCNSEVDVSLTSSESVSYGNKEDENKIYDESLCSKLRCWALTHRCTRQCINGALKLFLECKQSVPLDSRTLLKTKRSIASINIEGYGDYIYLGLKTQIEKQISSKSIKETSVYKHFLSLCLAIRFLCESDDATRNSNLQNAERLLRYFVTNSVDVYGHLFCVYNVHSLLHLCEDVQNYGVSLDNLSAFKFENYLQKLKKMISGTRNPLIQVAKRLDELNDFHQTPKNTFRISVSDKDNCFITNSSVVFVKNVVGDQFHCIKFKKHSLDNFFTDFVQSKDIDIFFLRKNAISTPCVKQKHDILRKCVCMPTHNGFVISALVHNVDTRQL